MIWCFQVVRIPFEEAPRPHELASLCKRMIIVPFNHNPSERVCSCLVTLLFVQRSCARCWKIRCTAARSTQTILLLSTRMKRCRRNPGRRTGCVCRSPTCRCAPRSVLTAVVANLHAESRCLQEKNSMDMIVCIPPKINNKCFSCDGNRSLPPSPPGSANCQIDRDALRWLNFANYSYTAIKYLFDALILLNNLYLQW